MKRQNLGTAPFMNDVSATKQHQILAMSMENKSLGDIKNEWKRRDNQTSTWKDTSIQTHTDRSYFEILEKQLLC